MTPSISAGTSTTQIRPMARRTPVSRWLAMAGTVMCQSCSRRLAPRLSARVSQSGSMARMPAATLRTMGQTAAKASRNTTGASPTPRAMTAMGIQDRGEIMRRNWKAVELARSKAAQLPSSRPSGMPAASAMARP